MVVVSHLNEGRVGWGWWMKGVGIVARGMGNFWDRNWARGVIGCAKSFD